MKLKLLALAVIWGGLAVSQIPDEQPEAWICGIGDELLEHTQSGL